MSANFLLPYLSMRQLTNTYGKQVADMHLKTSALGEEFTVWCFVQSFFPWQPRPGSIEMTYSSFSAPCLCINVSFKRERDAIGPDPDKGVHLGPGFPSVPQVTHRLVKETRKFWMMWSMNKCKSLSQYVLTYCISYLEEIRFASGLHSVIKTKPFNFLVKLNANIDFKWQAKAPANFFSFAYFAFQYFWHFWQF